MEAAASKLLAAAMRPSTEKKSGSAGESAPSRHMKMSINTFLPLLRREKIVTEASEGLLLMTHSAELASLTGGQACYSYAPSRV